MLQLDVGSTRWCEVQGRGRRAQRAGSSACSQETTKIVSTIQPPRVSQKARIPESSGTGAFYVVLTADQHWNGTELEGGVVRTETASEGRLRDLDDIVNAGVNKTRSAVLDVDMED